MIKAQYVKDFLNLAWELRKTIKLVPELKHLFWNIENAEEARPSLEKIIEKMKENSVTDDFLKISQTYERILIGEEDILRKDSSYACLEFMKDVGISTEVLGKENIPKEGGLLFVSNHPYGYLDGIALIGRLGSLVKERGQRFKVVASQNLKIIKGIEEVISFTSSTNSKRSDFSCLRSSLKYLDKGGNLAIYPSGTSGGAEFKEYPWKEEIIPFISHSSCVVPMWFSGPDNGVIYNFLAKHRMTENLREILGIRALWGKEGEKITLNIGKSIYSKDLFDLKNNKRIIQYLRESSEALRVY